MNRLRTLAALCSWMALAGSLAQAADETFFRRQVAPLLEQHCLRCHDQKLRRGGLSLATAADLAAGGDSGPTVVSGKPSESLLLSMVSGDKPKMPKKAAPLKPQQVAVLQKWISQGAAWPKDLTLSARKEPSEIWWSLRPLARPVVPVVKMTDRVRTPIDAFIFHRLEQQGMKPSAEADRRTLIRRLYFDLIGLPPEPANIDAFLRDPAPDAYERLVDRLLESPRYGERWARHWLDVVHYGDTHGYDKDKVRPHAWPYRDYVIRAFNEDRPYWRFIKEQIAGDVFYPDTRDGITALGFLAAGPWDFVGQVELREGTLDKNITRNLDRDDMVATVMNTFTSLTVQCARCHDHKFDPITQEDYYSLQAVFAAVDRADRPYKIDSQTDPKQPALVYAAATHFAPEGSFTPTGGKPRPIYLLKRGSEKNKVREVGPGTVACLTGLPSRFSLTDRPEGERRAALAHWITDPRNPLTWRSIVNRIWHYHFGQGLVDTPNDFGRMGGLPSHPELLDWLAIRFRDGGQSIKQLHRLIVTSSTYRQVSRHNTDHAQSDAGNRFLWRMNRRRLDAESIRDAVLAVSGKLDLKMYGPGFRTFGFLDDHSPHYKYEEYNPDDPAGQRRSIYRFVVRSAPDPFMETLDCPDPSLRVEKRNESLTALQALALLNDKFMLRMAEHLAARVEKKGGELPNQVAATHLLALGREPTAEEGRLLIDYAHKHGLANACRLILNTNEFSFVD
ncbi:MAG TPA: PSD1 and planctomycete cytochrome C domain-containing protein [Gemmataceae bacterium]